jgi:peroxiredoxin (alkyl hydroperoxide reductase subunit C)
MSLVGKSSSIAVDAISEMGDNLKINIFEEAINNNKKVLYFGIQRLYICMSN